MHEESGRGKGTHILVAEKNIRRSPPESMKGYHELIPHTILHIHSLVMYLMVTKAQHSRKAL
jgi:hypothetical protein